MTTLLLCIGLLVILIVLLFLICTGFNVRRLQGFMIGFGKTDVVDEDEDNELNLTSIWQIGFGFWMFTFYIR